VHFSNGSNVNLAKIKGSPTYKATMNTAPHVHARYAASLTDKSFVVDESGCACDHAPRDVPQPTSGVLHYLQRIQEHLPPWMGGIEPVLLDPNTRSLADMLRVLKFATETYLGTEISNATISLPFPIGHQRLSANSFSARLDQSASTLNLKVPPPATAFSNIIREDHLAKLRKRSPYTYFSCHPDDEGLALSVDFSDAALTAMIEVTVWDGDDDHSNIARILHRPDLGAKELFKVQDWREKLTNALRSVTASSTESEAEPDYINMLVLLGDAARDARLHEALQDVLGEHYDRLIATAKGDASNARDPQFLGVASAAHWNWRTNHYYHPHDDYGCLPPGPYPWFWRMVCLRMKDAQSAVQEWFRSANEKKVEAELAAHQKSEQLMKEFGQHPLVIGPP
jgi:hypothetical protein